MRFAERLTALGHASDARLLAIVAGEPAPAHVSSCASCQSRLGALRAWTTDTADGAAGIADEIFTEDRLAAQRARVMKRLEAAGRSARVIAFPAGTIPTAMPTTGRVVRWAAAAAIGGLMVGLGAGALFVNDGAGPAPAASASAPRPAAVPLSAIVASETLPGDALDEEGLLNAAYERVDVDALRTIDDITPRAREVAVNLPRRPLP